MAHIFAYIAHKGGAPDDSAFELAAAARKIDPVTSPRAILTGWVRTSMRRAIRSVPPILRFGKSQMKLWLILIPMQNWCEKPC